MKHSDKVYCSHVLSFTFRRVPDRFVRLVQARGCCWGAPGVPCQAVPGRVWLGQGLPCSATSSVCVCVPGVLPRGRRAAPLPGSGGCSNTPGTAGGVFHVWVRRGAAGPGLPSPAGMGGCRGNRSAAGAGP